MKSKGVCVMSVKSGLKKLALFGSMAVGMFACGEKEKVDPITPGGGTGGTKTETMDTLFVYQPKINVSLNFAQNVTTGERSRYFNAVNDLLPSEVGQVSIDQRDNNAAKIKFIGLERITSVGTDPYYFEAQGHENITGKNGEVYKDAIAIVATSVDANGAANPKGFPLPDGVDGTKRFTKVVKTIFNQFKGDMGLGDVPTTDFVKTSKDIRENENFAQYKIPATGLNPVSLKVGISPYK